MIKNMILILAIFTTINAKFIRYDDKKIVLDTTTSLLWSDDTISQEKFSDSLTTCNNLEIGRYKNWRRPTIKELYSLVDLTKIRPAMSDVFKNPENIVGGTYWSSTTTNNDRNNTAWVVNFSTGSIIHNLLMSNKLYVRCVHEY